MKMSTHQKRSVRSYHSTVPHPHSTQKKEATAECPNKCGATHIKRKAMKAHRDQCPLELVKCPYQCTQERPTGSVTYTKIMRKDLDKHLKQDCYLRPYKCEYCNHRGTYMEITGTGSSDQQRYHYQVCPGYPLDCPNNCGIGKVKRGDMNTHRQQCPEEDVPCPNGCSDQQERRTMLKRKQLKKHVNKECTMRPYQCEHCHMRDTQSGINAHYSMCPQMPIQCPFEEAGCKVKLVRQDLEKHNSTMVHQHLMMMMNVFKETKCKHERTKTELLDTKIKLDKATLGLNETRCELSDVKQSLSQYEKKVDWWEYDGDDKN